MENQLGVLTTEKQVLNQKIELLNQQFQHHESMRMHQYSSESIKKNTSITTSLNSTKNCNDNDTNSEEFSKKINSNAKIHTIIIDDVDPMRRSFNNNTNKNNYFEKIGPGQPLTNIEHKFRYNKNNQVSSELFKNNCSNNLYYSKELGGNGGEHWMSKSSKKSQMSSKENVIHYNQNNKNRNKENCL